jgi:vancomycin permeability regulator SanA
LQDQATATSGEIAPDCHRTLFATLQTDIQRLCRLIVSILEHVGIEVQGRADFAMAEALAHDGQWHAGIMQ